MHRRLADLGDEHLLEQRRERHGEIAVAAIQFEQVAPQARCLFAGPAKHLPVYGAIGLGETTFDLLVTQAAPVDVYKRQTKGLLQFNLKTLAFAPPLAIHIEFPFVAILELLAAKCASPKT